MEPEMEAKILYCVAGDFTVLFLIIDSAKGGGVAAPAFVSVPAGISVEAGVILT